MTLFQFPRWTDGFRPLLGIAAVLTPTYIVALFIYGASADTLQVGYAPEQPIPFSHALHAGKLGMDCRYCHSTVESADLAAIPPLATCMNCHKSIQTTSPLLAPLRAAWEGQEPLRWTKVHDLPEFAYFSHAPHLRAGVSCVDCHGRVDQMERVQTEKSLSMGWCLECHRNPEPFLRPREEVFNLGWTTEEDRNVLGAKLRKENGINPRTDCSTCHR